MSYSWVDHTAELELHLDGASEAAIFEQALVALAELIGADEPASGEEVALELELNAGDRPALLAAWLDELVFRAETESVIPLAVASLRLDDAGLTARVIARRGTPRHLVKGVTYHGLALERSGDGYRAAVVLDV
jgi:SHS2 domain-containing protein